jgi:hypothetical protein
LDLCGAAFSFSLYHAVASTVLHSEPRHRREPEGISLSHPCLSAWERDPGELSIKDFEKEGNLSVKREGFVGSKPVRENK